MMESSQESIVNQWVEKVASLTNPDNIYYCDGSRDEYERITSSMVKEKKLIKLNEKTYPGCFLYRRVSVRLYYGELYEGLLRKSEMSGFMHLEQRSAGIVVHRYVQLSDIMYFRYSVKGKRNSFEVEIVDLFKGVH